MTPEQAYDELVERSKELHLIESTSALATWDQQVYMPPNGAQSRSEMLSYLSRLGHRKLTDPRVGELLGLAGKSGGWKPEQAANLREWRRRYDRETKLPEEFVARRTRLHSESFEAWQKARKANDFSLFAPFLERIFSTAGEEAGYVGGFEEPYDALLDKFEPGLTAARSEKLLSQVKETIVPFLRKIAAAPAGLATDPFSGMVFPVEKQRALADRVARAIGFDYDSGRADISAHPFTSGIDAGDVRITTRYNESNPLFSLFGVIHEAGHAMYEQGLPHEHRGTPMARSMSLGIHESQSRFWENHIGRSRPFWEHWFPVFKETYGGAAAGISFDDFYRHINQVEPSLIRVEADELTYHLHIVIRFEIERDLLNGRLQMKDLPQVWNRRYRDYLGVEATDDYSGVLQDVHWSTGAVGYFPTYTLGSICSAQLDAAMRRDIPDLDGRLRKGDFSPPRQWLREHVHKLGSLYPPAELIEHATGKPPDAGELISYLTRKYGEIYRID